MTKLPRGLGIGIIVAATALSALAGGAVTRRKSRLWYRVIRKSPLNPPDAVFGPVWTVLYGLSTTAAIRLFLAKPSGARSVSLAAWALQQVLNAAWSPLFFGKRKARLALADVCLLWLALGGLVPKAKQVDRVSGLLLAPYLAWVSFAAYLNSAVVRRNPRWLT